MKLGDAFRMVGEELLELTPEERRAILDFQFPDMFRWDDDKWYYEGKPMVVRGLGLSHAEARFVHLLVSDMLGFVDCGEGPGDDDV